MNIPEAEITLSAYKETDFDWRPNHFGKLCHVYLFKGGSENEPGQARVAVGGNDDGGLYFDGSVEDAEYRFNRILEQEVVTFDFLKALGFLDEVSTERRSIAVVEPLPYWPACNPGCDPEFNGRRSPHCARLCEPARRAMQESKAADPLGLRGCVHPECGRFYDHNAQRLSCRAIANGACVAKTDQ